MRGAKPPIAKRYVMESPAGHLAALTRRLGREPTNLPGGRLVSESAMPRERPNYAAPQNDAMCQKRTIGSAAIICS